MNSKLKITIRKSKILLGYFALMTGLALSAAFFIDLDFTHSALLWAYISIFAFYYFCRYFSKYRISEINFHDSGLVDFASEKKLYQNLKLHPNSRVLNKLVILKAGGHRVIILPDSLDKEAFRQLKVYLRFAQ